MILQIEVKNEGKVDYASCKKQDGADSVNLHIKNISGVTIQVMLQADMGGEPSNNKWLPYPNNDRTSFTISSDGVYGLTPSNSYLQLIVPDGTNTAGIVAMLA